MATSTSTSIAIVGDFDPDRAPHVATEAAIAHAAADLAVRVESRWLATSDLEHLSQRELDSSVGFFVAPGSPYRSMRGALRAIRHARENGRPLLGTCGGFQHVIVEIAQNLLGRTDPLHAEIDPKALQPIIAPLACSLVGERAPVRFVTGSRVRSIYGALEAREEYRCSFGLVRSYEVPLEGAGLVVSGRDAAGEPRVVELTGHPFYFATLFVPQLSSAPATPHPLVRAFVEACARSDVGVAAVR